MELINGKALAEAIKDGIVKEIIPMGDQRPNLAIILVGEREDSKIYVSLKEKQAKIVGIDTHLYKLDADTNEAELLAAIDHLNNDDLIDGILLQLPLPEGFDTKKIVGRIKVEKDIDGFHPENLEKYLAGKPVLIEPLLVSVMRLMLLSIKYDLAGKRALALVNSEFFGKTMKYALASQGADADFCYADDPELKNKTSQADILVTALGKPQLIKGDMIKKDAVIIDIGITKLADGKIVGDVDCESVMDVVSYLTPVPGGVGPMTIALALQNTLILHKQRKG